jgi:hypothetical protein
MYPSSVGKQKADQADQPCAAGLQARRSALALRPWTLTWGVVADCGSAWNVGSDANSILLAKSGGSNLRQTLLGQPALIALAPETCRGRTGTRRGARVLAPRQSGPARPRPRRRPLPGPRRPAGGRPRSAFRTACRRAPGGTRRPDARAGGCVRPASRHRPRAPGAPHAKAARTSGGKAVRSMSAGSLIGPERTGRRGVCGALAGPVSHSAAAGGRTRRGP